MNDPNQILTVPPENDHGLTANMPGPFARRRLHVDAFSTDCRSRLMTPSIYFLIIILASWLVAGHARAECNCRQPAYKDQIDYITRYMACLDECLNAQMQQISQEIKAHGQRISDLEAAIKGLQQRINRLDMKPPSAIKDKKQN